MIRDFTQRAVNEANEMLNEIEREVSQFEVFQNLQELENGELNIFEYISEAERYKNNLIERNVFLKGRFYASLMEVNQIDEKFSIWFKQSKEVLDALTERVGTVCQMLTPEKLSMPTESYAIEMKSIRDTYLNMDAIRYLLLQGITEEQINNMQTMGYQPHEIRAVWESLATEEDRNFYIYLMEGTEEAYEQAFAINPNDLSEHMMLVLSDYACHFLMTDGNGEYIYIHQLELFNNALLSANQMYYYPENEETAYWASSLCYSDIYMNMLQSGTRMLLESATFTLAELETNNPTYSEILERYGRELSMANLWASEQFMIQEIIAQGIPGMEHAIRLSNIQFSGGQSGIGNFDFQLEYSDGRVQQVSSELLISSLELDIQHGAERLEHMRSEQNRLMQNMILEMLEGSLTISAGFIAPELGLMVSAVCMAYGDGSSLSDLDSIANTDMGRLGINQSQNVIDHMVAYFISDINSNSALSQAEWDEKMDMFGLGGMTIIDGEDAVTFSGMYDPDVLRKILIWEEKGPAGLMGWSEDKIDGIKDGIVKGNVEEGQSELCSAILDGRYSILTDSYIDKNGKIVNVPFEEFQKALREIDNKSGEVDRLQSAFSN